MRTNNFTQNMLKKSNAALENILEDKKMYTDEAIQAVIWELENRNIIEKGSITHNPVISEKDVLIEEKEVDKANHEASSEATDFPVLYSKRAIQGFTIFFSTLFGAVLLMSNLKKMSHDHVFLETTEIVVLAPDRGFRENLCGLLERCCRDEGFSRQTCLRNA